MNARHGDLADRLARLLNEEAQSGLVSAYLYGSHAEERSHRESDVDVGILLSWASFPSARERFEQRVATSSRLTGKLGGTLVDVVVLNDAPPLFARHIIYTGVRVFCSDPELDHAFVRDTQLKAADLEPFLRRYGQIGPKSLSHSSTQGSPALPPCLGPSGPKPKRLFRKLSAFDSEVLGEVPRQPHAAMISSRT
ncbi:MAG: type VII toxin-antitoxin system MntA family adenylyltransferase antitoxin [Gemmatimonadota bacterium]